MLEIVAGLVVAGAIVALGCVLLGVFWLVHMIWRALDDD